MKSSELITKNFQEQHLGSLALRRASSLSIIVLNDQS